jgi:hypothetical protein
LAHHTDSTIIKVTGEWARYKHIGHSITVVGDTTGLDEDYDELYDSILEYIEVDSESKPIKGGN